jgi:hypothetical protein
LPSASDVTFVDSTRWNVKGSGVVSGEGSWGREFDASSAEPSPSTGGALRIGAGLEGSRDAVDGEDAGEHPTNTLTNATIARGMRP